jgi:hypothetical protein
VALAERPEPAGDDLRDETMPLSELRPGQKAILTAIEAPTALAHRLMALGLVPGTSSVITACWNFTCVKPSRCPCTKSTRKRTD